MPKTNTPLTNLIEKREKLNLDTSQDAALKLNSGFLSLVEYTLAGDKDALETLHSLGCDLCKFLAGAYMEAETKDFLLSLMKKSESWPVLLSAAASARKKEIDSFKSLPLGDSHTFKLNTILGRGNKTDWKKNGSADVASRIIQVLLAIKANAMRGNKAQLECLKLKERYEVLSISKEGVTDEMMDLHCKRIDFAESIPTCNERPSTQEWADFYGVDVSLIKKIKNLPKFTRQNITLWISVICEFAVDNETPRSKYIPACWKDSYNRQLGPNQRGYGAEIRNKLTRAVKPICPSGD